MARLNEERQRELEPKRMEYAIAELLKLGYTPTFVGDKILTFIFKGEKVSLFPYSGWHSGKPIKDGRGIEKLLKQLK